MKKLKHVQLFESFTNEGMEMGSTEPLAPVDISNSSDVIVTYLGPDGQNIIGLISPSEAEQLKSTFDNLEEDDTLKFYTKPGVAYVGLSLYFGFDGGDAILAGPDYEPVTAFYLTKGGYGTDYGTDESAEVKVDSPEFSIHLKYNPQFFNDLKREKEIAYYWKDKSKDDFAEEIFTTGTVATLKRGYLTVFGGASSQGYGSDAKTLPFKEALEEIKGQYMD